MEEYEKANIEVVEMGTTAFMNESPSGGEEIGEETGTDYL